MNAPDNQTSIDGGPSRRVNYLDQDEQSEDKEDIPMREPFDGEAPINGIGGGLQGSPSKDFEDHDQSLSLKSRGLFFGDTNSLGNQSGFFKSAIRIESIQKQKERVEANQKLMAFKKALAKKTDLPGAHIMTYQQYLEMIPKEFKEGDWEEPTLYAYFTVKYLKEELFLDVLKRANYFAEWRGLQKLFFPPETSFANLTAELDRNLNREELNRLSFEAALNKDYQDVAYHLIQTSQVTLKWEMVRKMLANRQEYLVKQCIKLGTKFDSGDASTKKIVFAGRAGKPNESRTIRLVDFIHIMLEQKWSSQQIRNVVTNYSRKGKLDTQDLREMFLVFAMKRKIKLMSMLINEEEFNFDFTDDNFLDILENSAYDIGVLLYREYFLHLTEKGDKIVQLLVNSFSETNGMLESKAFLLKRFITQMKFEQAMQFLEAVEKGVKNKSRGNILIMTLNVVKSSCLLVELLEQVKDNFAFLERRIQEIRQSIVSIAQEYMRRVDNEEEMQYLLLEVDIDHRDSLSLIYNYEIVELLETPNAQKIVLNIWESGYNVSSSIFTTSSSHNLLFNYNHCRYDMETKLRWNKAKDLNAYGTHGFMFEVWRSSAKSRFFVFSIGFLLNTYILHEVIMAQITQSIKVMDNMQEARNSLDNCRFNPACMTKERPLPEDIQPLRNAYDIWVDEVDDLYRRAMWITFLMYGTWMFTFHHIFEAVYAAKNKRQAKFVLIENVLDFIIMLIGMGYIAIVYRVYRYDTFLTFPDKEDMAERYLYNFNRFTVYVDDQILLLIIDLAYLAKAGLQLRLLPIIGPAFAIFKMLLKELAIFGLFFFLQQFIFSVVGNLLFYDLPSYSTLGASMLTIFQASAGVFNNEEMKNARKNSQIGYVFILVYMIFCFILILNLIVGQLSSAYKRYLKKRSVLYLLETLSVREASEADEKYSAAISCPYPLNILNLFLGAYVLAAKKPKHNRWILHFYFLPTLIGSLAVFIVYQALILPLAYLKILGHKIALVLNNPSGEAAKSRSDRMGLAFYFLILGVPILILNSISDIFLFVRHTYKTDLDKMAKQKLEDKGMGITNSINRRTFKKMLNYFELQSGKDKQQIALQTDVCIDIREYLKVKSKLKLGFKDLFHGTNSVEKETTKSQYYALEKTVTEHEATTQNFITERQEDLMKKVEDPLSKTSFEQAMDQIQEYNMVKQMMINNSLPVSQGHLDSQSQQVFTRKLFIDKKIMHNLLIDLQRFRKLLNLKKRFYIFQVSYDGKPKEMEKWHKKVEVRVTQTFRQLNIRRLIDIIGYDPPQYFRGELSNQNIQNIRQGQAPGIGGLGGPFDGFGGPSGPGGNSKPTSPSFPGHRMTLKGSAGQARLDRRLPDGPSPTQFRTPQFMNDAKKTQGDSARGQAKLEENYRFENLSQNLGSVGSKFEVASRQLKDLIDIFRKTNGGRQIPSDLQMRLQKTLSAHKHFDPIDPKGSQPTMSKEFMSLKDSLAKPKPPSQQFAQANPPFLFPPAPASPAPPSNLGSKKNSSYLTFNNPAPAGAPQVSDRAGEDSCDVDDSIEDSDYQTHQAEAAVSSNKKTENFKPINSNSQVGISGSLKMTKSGSQKRQVQAEDYGHKRTKP